MESLLRRYGLLLLASLSGSTALNVDFASQDGHSLTFSHGNAVLHHTILSGDETGSPRPANVKQQRRSELTLEDGGKVEWHNIDQHSVKVQTKYAQVKPVGAAFGFPAGDLFYGVWEYPWNGSITNNNHSYADIGIYGEQPGINWSNARAPFFFSKSGFGVYVDTTELGNFDFSIPGQVRFAFNASSLTYSVMYNTNLTALLMQFSSMTNKIEMPPESGYGPIVWSDDWEQDFHTGVTNSEENFYDVVSHLYYGQIRATAMFADRPYGTGNMSFGNFDFNPAYFPEPESLIANLSSFGYDFQVWVANRAFINTQLFGTASANGWLFPDISPLDFLGPALNLSIPAASEYFLQRLSYFARMGVKGFKIDRGEEREMPDTEQNSQTSHFISICYRAMADVWGQGNFYNFARSAFDRDRARTAIWNGDSTADFTGLAFSVASGIRAGLLGFSQWGSDTGGYLRSANSPTEEVFARWMHFSAFSPMYELLLGGGHTPWYDYSPALVAVFKKTADLHTRLIPYIRSYQYQATQTGLPVVRALFLEYPADDAVYDVSDAYAFGSELFIAPIITPGGNRAVRFPRGTGRFLEYFNKTLIFSGGDTHNVTDLPLDTSPAYVREGAIVPTGDIYQGNARWVNGWTPRLSIDVFPSYNVSRSVFTYYRGHEGVGRPGPATITVTTDARARSIVVEYEDLGVDGTINIWYRGGPQNVTRSQSINLPSGGWGQVLRIDGLNSLFD